MMLRLQYSGYDQKFRTGSCAISTKSRVQPCDRARREWWAILVQTKRMETARTGSRETTKGYRKGGFDTVIFVPATPGSQLKWPVHRRNKRSGFQDHSGRASRCDPQEDVAKVRPIQRKKKCNNINCLVCNTGGKGPCRSVSVTYELICQLCRHKYTGKTSRSAYALGKEHLRALEQRKESSVMWRHSCEKHDGNASSFTMNVTGTF